MVDRIDMLMPMASAQTIFVIGGKDTKPSQVRARDVALALEKLEIAILAAARSKDPSLDDAACIVSLTDVVPGSTGLQMAVPESLVGVLVVLSVAVATGDFSGLPVKAQAAVLAIDQRLTPRYGEWGFNENKQLGIVQGRVTKERRVAAPAEPRLLESHTTVYGWLYDAGGKGQPRLEIVVDDRRLHVELDRDLARQAGGRLYTTVGLEGVAFWNPNTLEIERFRAVRLLPYEERGLTEALKRVAVGAHDSLAKVDLVKHFVSDDEDGG